MGLCARCCDTRRLPSGLYGADGLGQRSREGRNNEGRDDILVVVRNIAYNKETNII